jgi:predicted histone-like DNA-binding protein
MKYKLIQRINPLDRSKKKWYAAPVSEGKISKSDLAKEIVTVSSLSRGDVSNTIECLTDVCPKYLAMSKSVSLGDLGTLRLSFSSEGVDNPEDFNVNMISDPRVLFIPSVELKNQLANIKFEKAE